MDKFNYIVKTLARTKRKDYENYVINRIWNKLDDLDIKPVSQQYVKRKNGQYALIDLYFPQFNIGIECDEFHHIQEANESGFTSDELRTEDIISAIENYEEIRVPIYNENGDYREIEDINRNLDEIVERILSAPSPKKSRISPFVLKKNLSEVLINPCSFAFETSGSFVHFSKFAISTFRFLILSTISLRLRFISSISR